VTDCLTMARGWRKAGIFLNGQVEDDAGLVTL
jgi:hypothetical protein